VCAGADTGAFDGVSDTPVKASSVKTSCHQPAGITIASPAFSSFSGV
jgi:hypothetical protein